MNPLASDQLWELFARLQGAGRIFWVKKEIPGEEPIGHAYVIPDGARGGKYPLNEPKYRLLGQERMTIEEVLKRGIDRTQEFQKLLEDMTQILIYFH